MVVGEEVFERLADRKLHSDARRRQVAVDVEMTPEWKADMQVRLAKIEREPASAKSKIAKLYALLDEAHQKRVAQVACKRGCDACCHVQVEISQVEADRIAEHTRRVAMKFPPGRHTTPVGQLGRADTPCPFLANRECSIYDVRPLVCRDMAVLDVDALACSFENMELARRQDPRMLDVPQSTVRPVVGAFAVVVVRPGSAFADIRQFFSQPRSGDET